MPKQEYTTKRREFKHLTEKQRIEIEVLLKQKQSKSKIAKEVGIARSTLYEELKRGTVEQMDSELRPYRKYFSDVGQRVYAEHRQNSRKPYKLPAAYEFIRYAEERILKDKLSVDAVCGRAALERRFPCMVCAKTLYNYIDQCLLRVKNIDLPLRVKRNNRHERVRKNRVIYGESIDQRPQSVNDRQEFGHWEIDTVIGTREQSPVFLTLDERMTRKRHLIRISARTAEAVAEGMKKIRALYGDRFQAIFRSITADNGSEFSHLAEAVEGVCVYYAHPYSSFERGTNEKQNSLVRRFFPKGHSIADVSEETISFVEDWINNLPRRLLDFHTANELFEKAVAA